MPPLFRDWDVSSAQELRYRSARPLFDMIVNQMSSLFGYATLAAALVVVAVFLFNLA